LNKIKRRHRILSLIFIFFWVVPCAFGESTEIWILRELLRDPCTEEKFLRLLLGEAFTQEMFF